MTLHTTEHKVKVDVREIAPRQRHPLIFSTFAQLPEGWEMEPRPHGLGNCCGTCGGNDHA